MILCPNSALPSCLCYDSAGNYVPQSFDGMAQSCSQIAVTASPKLLSLITGTGGSLGFCTKFAGPANNTVVTTTASNTAATAYISTGESQSSARPTTATQTGNSVGSVSSSSPTVSSL